MRSHASVSEYVNFVFAYKKVSSVFDILSSLMNVQASKWYSLHKKLRKQSKSLPKLMENSFDERRQEEVMKFFSNYWNSYPLSRHEILEAAVTALNDYTAITEELELVPFEDE